MSLSDLTDLLPTLIDSLGSGGAKRRLQIRRILLKLDQILENQPGELASNDRSLNAIEARVDEVLESLGMTYSEPTPPAEVVQAVREGRDIEAIKIHREQPGSSLAEAHDVVSRLKTSVASGLESAGR